MLVALRADQVVWVPPLPDGLHHVTIGDKLVAPAATVAEELEVVLLAIGLVVLRVERDDVERVVAALGRAREVVGMP